MMLSDEAFCSQDFSAVFGCVRGYQEWRATRSTKWTVDRLSNKVRTKKVRTNVVCIGLGQMPGVANLYRTVTFQPTKNKTKRSKAPDSRPPHHHTHTPPRVHILPCRFSHDSRDVSIGLGDYRGLASHLSLRSMWSEVSNLTYQLQFMVPFIPVTLTTQQPVS